MGQKVNPKGFRVAVTKDWDSKWFAKDQDFGAWLQEDLRVRDMIKKDFYEAAIARILIHRAANRVAIDIHTARPGVLSSRKGKYGELQDALAKMLQGRDVKIEIIEVKRAETNAQLAAENVAFQLEKRVGFRRAMKKVIQTAMENGAEGVKVRVSGRLGGAELARTEQYREGKVPLHTLRADIDYGFAEARTTAGKIGVKVWICNPAKTAMEG